MSTEPTSHLPAFPEPASSAEARAIRHLVGGGSLVARAKHWLAFPEEDLRRRALARVSQACVLDWLDRGLIHRLGPGRVCLVHPDAPANGFSCSRNRGGIFADWQARAQTGAGPIDLTLVEAGARLAADVERASLGPIRTQGWGGRAVFVEASRVGGGGPGGPDPVGAAARARLARISEQLSADTVSLLLALCIEGETLAGLAQRFGLSEGAMRVNARDALRALSRVDASGIGADARHH
jgi:hypothetical protein